MSIIFFIFTLLMGCSNFEKAEQTRLRQMNAKGEFIHRSHDEVSAPIGEPVPQERAPYPWEKK